MGFPSVSEPNYVASGMHWTGSVDIRGPDLIMQHTLVSDWSCVPVHLASDGVPVSM